MTKPKVAFICVHNSCRSQIAEALGKHLRADEFEFYSAGTQLKPQINRDAVRLMKRLYGIDMEKTQYPKLISDIPEPDITISMGCDVGCPFIGRAFDDDWGGLTTRREKTTRNLRQSSKRYAKRYLN